MVFLSGGALFAKVGGGAALFFRVLSKSLLKKWEGQSGERGM